MYESLRRLTSGVSQAAWGYFFLHININIGSVSILPAFVGYLLMLSAIAKLSGERRELGLLRPLCIILAIWNGADWLASFAGMSLDGLFTPLDILVSVAGLYFHFQFLTDMAALAERCQPQDSPIARRLINRRTVYVTLMAVTDVLFSLPSQLWGSAQAVIAILCGLASAVAALTAMFSLFSLRRCLIKNAESV